MRLKLFVAALALASLTACNSSSSKKEEGYTDLFNGKNLDGWHQLNGQGKVCR